MPHPYLLVEDHPAGYRWLRLARPERRNALDPGLLAAVRDALAARYPRSVIQEREEVCTLEGGEEDVPDHRPVLVDPTEVRPEERSDRQHEEDHDDDVPQGLELELHRVRPPGLRTSRAGSSRRSGRP